ncbi:MAG: tripartite tricarboxylate transporter permease [Desulfovibrionaceae bacterium]|nr:tripartite tricarboxylate transporter permease [Desulfovibrionaceae bacterium]
MLAWLLDLGAGIGNAMELSIFAAAFLGVIVGVVIGVIPGLGPAVAISLSIPLTYTLGPATAIAFMLGIYKGGTYGGSISAILINTPGTPAAAATVLDGYPMAKQGKAGKALGIALYASVFGDAFSILILCVLAEPIARAALRFGPTELFSLLLFALTIVASLSGKNLIKGLIAAALGLAVCMVGMDAMTGIPRLTFGILALDDGFSIVPMVIGMFAVTEVINQAESRSVSAGGALLPTSDNPDDNRVSWKDFKRCLPIFAQSSLVGVGIGALPGTGSTTAAYLSYGMAQKRSKHPEEFGKGSIEGLAAAESGNNAVCGGALIPMLTLGIPGDVVTAILMSALIVHGVHIGPMIFNEHRVFVFTLFGMLIVSILMLYLVGLVAIRGCRKLATMPHSLVMPIVLLLCVVGSYAVSYSMTDVWMMLGFGVLGYAMNKLEIPLPPFIIAFVLGPMLEQSLRRALILSRGDYSIFVTHPISLGFLALAVFSVWGIVRGARKKLGD